MLNKWQEVTLVACRQACTRDQRGSGHYAIHPQPPQSPLSPGCIEQPRRLRGVRLIERQYATTK